MPLIELTDRALLCFTGKDVHPFLQGLVTQDITFLSAQDLIYACFLTPQGRFLFDFFIFQKDDAVWLDYEAPRKEELIKKLKLYILRSNVIISDPLIPYKVYASWAHSLIEPTCFHQGEDPRLPSLGYRIYTTTSFSECEAFDCYEQHRLSLGIPSASRDLIPETSLLLESNMDELHAISWTKGCYMGQELTSRTKYTLVVRKRLIPCHIQEGETATGDVIFDSGKEVGSVRSMSGSLAMCFLRLPYKPLLTTQHGAVLEPFVPEWLRTSIKSLEL